MPDSGRVECSGLIFVCELCGLKPNGGVGGRPTEGRISSSAVDVGAIAASLGFLNISAHLFACIDIERGHSCGIHRYTGLSDYI